MTPADQYRLLAAKLHAQARREKKPHISAELDNLAHCYTRLAEQADLNNTLDVTYEPILRPFKDDPRSDQS